MSSASLPVVPDPPAKGPFEALRRLDWALVALTVILIAFGMLMITSASSLHADVRYGDPTHFVVRQGMGVGVGVLGIVALLFCPIRWIRSYGWVLYLAGIIGLILVFTPLGHRAYGATRWLSLGPIKIQPSEFARLGLVLWLGWFLSKNSGRIHEFVGVIVPAIAMGVPMVVLLMTQPDFGTTVLTSALVMVMLFVAGIRWAVVGGLGLVGGVLIGIGAIIEPYRIRRLLSFTSPLDDPTGAGHQVVQGWIAMASGGWFGQGMAGGVAQRGNLPEAHTDFIAAVVGEDLGAMGISLLILLFIVFIWRGYAIAARARTPFGSLVATALTTLLASQAVVNLAVLVGWSPPKGLVLPFLSYGASAVVAHLLCVGMLLRISIDRDPDAPRGAP